MPRGIRNRVVEARDPISAPGVIHPVKMQYRENVNAQPIEGIAAIRVQAEDGQIAQFFFGAGTERGSYQLYPMSDLEARLQDNSFLGGRRVWLTDDALSVEEFQSLQELEAVSITLVVPEEPVEPEVAVEEKVVVEEPAVEEPPAETFDFDPNDFSPTYGQGPVGVQPVESREPVVEETPESESVYDDVRDYLKEELGISRVDGINPERIMQVEQAISIAVVDIGQAIADGRFDERYYEDVIDYVAGFDEGQQDEICLLYTSPSPRDAQ